MPQTIRTAPLQLSGHQAVEETVSTLLHEPAGDQPVLSLYADLSGSPLEVVTEIELRARAIIHVLPPESRESLAEGVEQAKDFAALAAEVPEARGMAVFFRGGSATESIWIPMAFAVPMPTWVLVDRLPRLYHLMEAKQMFRNYVVVKVESDKLNIMELRMGRITERFLAQTDDDWGEIGRRIGREQFAERNRRRREQTVSSQADWLHAYVMKKPHSRVVLVGHPRDVELFAKSLSSAVVERMIDPNESVAFAPQTDMATCIRQLSARESCETKREFDLWRQKYGQGGLASRGMEDVSNALAQGAVQTLFLSADGLPLHEREGLIRSALTYGGDVHILQDTMRADGVAIAATLRFRPEAV